MRPSFRGLVVLAAIGLLPAACGDDDQGPPTAADVTTVNVTSTAQTLTFLGQTAQLSAEGRTSDGQVVSGIGFQYATSSGSVATVSSTGLVEAVGNGNATITATVSGGTASGTVQITVEQAVEALALDPEEGELTVGGTLQLTASATDQGGAEVPDPALDWTSSDEDVASVDGEGLVTGVGPGPVTITASATGGAEASSELEVILEDLVVTEDRELEGELHVDRFTVMPGVTVTMTGDLTVRAAGMVDIQGTLEGDCHALDMRGDTAVTITGTVDNGCSDAEAEPAAMHVGANGELTLEGATVVSSGDIDFTNDPTLTDDDFPEAGAAPRRAPRRAGPGVPFTRVDNSTVRYHGGGTGPDPARDGEDGVNGTDGADGRRVAFRLRGNAVFAGGTTLWGQDAGRGGNGEDTQNTDLTVNGGVGGNGGDILIWVTGTLTYEGAENIVRSGAGGAGGMATATATENAEEDKAPSATAVGGAGGSPGLVEFRAGEGIVNEGSLVIEIGAPGPGGDAEATGAKGADATEEDPAQEGGDADATGGAGGSTPDKQLVREGDVVGADPTIRQTGGGPIDGGRGGHATATAGNGGNGLKPNKDGGRGGNLNAVGGKGGDALLKDRLGGFLGEGGVGGMASFAMGNGGQGWDDCEETLEEGGKGGAGGTATGTFGEGGMAAAKAADGTETYDNVANGGMGGDGDGPGAGGDAGTRVPAPAGPIPGSFEPGDPGLDCGEEPEEPQTASGHAQPSSIQQSAGAVSPGLHEVAVTDGGGQTIASFLMEALGPAGNAFVGFNPDRFGYFGDHGWLIHWNSLEVPNSQSSQMEQVQLCFVNTSPSESNPIVMEQLDAEGGVVETQTLTTLAAPPAGVDAAQSEPPGCRNVVKHAEAEALRVRGPLDLFADFLAFLVIFTFVLAP